jgi:hypothetical protein
MYVDNGSIVAFGTNRPMGGLSLSGDFSGFLGWAQAINGLGAVGLAMDQFRLGGIECRTGESHDPEAEISYAETMLSFQAATGVLDELSIGSGIVLYGQSFGAFPTKSQSWGASGTLGADYQVDHGLRIGLTCRLPATLTWQGAVGDHVSDRVSTRAALGVEVLPLTNLSVAADVAATATRPLAASAGGEYKLILAGTGTEEAQRALSAALRAGVKDITLAGSHFRSSPGITAGTGLEYAMSQFVISVDYVFVYGPSEFKDYHALALTLSY